LEWRQPDHLAFEPSLDLAAVHTEYMLLFKQSFLPFPVSLCPLRFESCCADGVEWVARPPLDALVSSDER